MINMVDEVTQYRQLASVRRIHRAPHGAPCSRYSSAPSPFPVHAFDADSASAYVNHEFADLLNRPPGHWPLPLAHGRTRRRPTWDRIVVVRKSGSGGTGPGAQAPAHRFRHECAWAAVKAGSERPGRPPEGTRETWPPKESPVGIAGIGRVCRIHDRTIYRAFGMRDSAAAIPHCAAFLGRGGHGVRVLDEYGRLATRHQKRVSRPRASPRSIGRR